MRQDGVAVFWISKYDTHWQGLALHVLLDRQQKGKEWCKHPSSWIQGYERIGRGWYLRHNQPFWNQQLARTYIPSYLSMPNHLHPNLIRIPDAKKDSFYDELRPVVAEIPTSDILILLVDWNGHAANPMLDMRECIADMSGAQEIQRERLLELAMSCNLVISKTCFRKWSNHLTTFTLGKARTHVDYMLFCKSFWDSDSLPEVYPVEGPASLSKNPKRAIKLMKCGKAAGTSLITAEMLKASGVVAMPSTTHCTWPLPIWVRDSIVHSGVSSGELFTSCWLQPEFRVQCENGCSSRLLPDAPTVHHGSGSLSPRVTYMISMRKPVCRCPVHHHWIAGGTAIEANTEGRELRVNMGKTMVMVSGPGLDVLQKWWLF